MIKLSDDFLLSEFVSREIYERYGHKSLWFVNPKLVELVQFIRNYFDVPLYINTWDIGEGIHNVVYEQSGFRAPYVRVGARFSQHRFGNAADIKMTNTDSEYIRKTILENQETFYNKGLTAIELNTPTWVHVDVRNSSLKNKILTFNHIVRESK